MKLLVVADEEDKALWDYYRPGMLDPYDLIVSCGDLNHAYLEFLATMAHCPVLYVRGNHDRAYDIDPPEGCICIENRVYDYKGLRLLGLGGSMRYQPYVSDQYDEKEMEGRIRRMSGEIFLRNGFDVLVTHSPARGWGDMDDLPHRGFECFNGLLEKWKPAYMFYGHVHKSYEPGTFQRVMRHSSGTVLVNAYQKCVQEIGKDEYPAVGKTGSFIYDLMMEMRERRRRF